MGVVFGDEHGHGFAKIAAVDGRPGFLPLHDPFVGVENDQRCQVTFVGDADGVAVPVDLA